MNKLKIDSWLRSIFVISNTIQPDPLASTADDDHLVKIREQNIDKKYECKYKTQSFELKITKSFEKTLHIFRTV